MIDINAHVQNLRDEGITFIEGVYTKEQCEDYKRRAKKVVEKLVRQGSNLICDDCESIVNPFRHDIKFLDFIYHDFLDQILKKLIDPDYAMITTSMNNRRISDKGHKGTSKLGAQWHTDSRYYDGGKRLDQGFSFIAITALDDFTKENGGTMYVPKSHKLRTMPEREGNYDYKVIETKAGSMAIFDTGLWHRAGPAGMGDRWAAISYYGPWYVKPYYWFPELIKRESGEDFIYQLTPTQRRLLHFYSIPPINEEERLNTVMKEGSHPVYDQSVEKSGK